MDGEFHKRGVVNIITVLDCHNDIGESVRAT